MLVNVNDLLRFVGIFIGVCLLFAIGVLLLIALVRIIRITKKVNILLDDNTENVTKTIKKLPELAENMDQASVSVKVNADKVGTSVENIGDALTETPTGEVTDTLMSIVNIAEGVAKMIINLFSKKE